LEQLEGRMIPADEPKVWQIIMVDSDGTRTLGERIEGSPRGRRREAKTTLPAAVRSSGH
jgi:hypothetical protein